MLRNRIRNANPFRHPPTINQLLGIGPFDIHRAKQAPLSPRGMVSFLMRRGGCIGADVSFFHRHTHLLEREAHTSSSARAINIQLATLHPIPGYCRSNSGPIFSILIQASSMVAACPIRTKKEFDSLHSLLHNGSLFTT